MPINTKRPKAHTKPKPPRAFLTAKARPAVAIKVTQLPHLTFYGPTFEEANRNMAAELTRLNPQGFSVEWPTDISNT